MKLREELNAEWQKPKSKNLKKDKKGKIVDSREPRDYEKIENLHKQINDKKMTQ